MTVSDCEKAPPRVRSTDKECRRVQELPTNERPIGANSLTPEEAAEEAKRRSIGR
jgi:hypothetical protein